MPTAIGLWYVQHVPRRVFQVNSLVCALLRRSKTIQPGEPTEIGPVADLRITNVALGDEVADEKSRTTVKIHYRPPGSQDDSDEEDEDEDEEKSGAELETAILCSLTYGKVRHDRLKLTGSC